ncbi:hypothetical protein KC799_03305 [candidate division KSB1 bacterium]|nr:hypothetical protein [candidate division KSB1 bacterium]
MKNTIVLINLILISTTAFAQSLVIYKTDQTTSSFELTNVDSITFSIASQAPALDLDNWDCVLTQPVIEKIVSTEEVVAEIENGLKIYGKGEATEAGIRPKTFSIESQDEKQIYLKWKTEDNGTFMSVILYLLSDTTSFSSMFPLLNLTTEYAAEGSTVITDNTWYYTRVEFHNNEITSITSIEKYDDNGGLIIQNVSTIIPEPVKTFVFGTKANNGSAVILGEARME